MPSATTRVAGVIGDPVEHSLSPVLHNAAFRALGMDWVYVAFRVPAGQGASAVEAMRALELAGLSVTMPLKAEVAAAVDRLGPVARALGVANTVSWSTASDGSSLVGESTDGGGYVDALSDDGFDPSGRSCVVLGSGGAARAVVHALATAGASSVAVVGRRSEPVSACAALAGSVGRGVVAGDASAVRSCVEAADLLVNATPVGMEGDEMLPMEMDGRWLRSGQFVSDLVYAPPNTPLLAAARRAGATSANGLGMLIHQAARQVELWTGRPPPLEAMSAAVVGELSRSTG